MINARASSDRCVVRDAPGKADILLGRSLLWGAEQKDQQEETICFHDVILVTVKQHTQSNTLTSNVSFAKSILKCNISYFAVNVIWAYLEY